MIRYDTSDEMIISTYQLTAKMQYIIIIIIRFWRNNGVAFTWLEGEPVRSNPTLLNNIIQHGPGFIHYAYLGDIVNGPFFTWATVEKNEDK